MYLLATVQLDDGRMQSSSDILYLPLCHPCYNSDDTYTGNGKKITV